MQLKKKYIFLVSISIIICMTLRHHVTVTTKLPRHERAVFSVILWRQTIILPQRGPSSIEQNSKVVNRFNSIEILNNDCKQFS
jgi:hypothetical protein